MKTTNIALLFLLFFCANSYAQQDPQFTQYMYNMNVVNPAYTKSEKGLLNLGVLYRSQWQNTIGAPNTLSFFAHSVLSDKIEMGLSVIGDEIGDGAMKENNLALDFAYILKLDEKSDISLGLKAGLTNFESNFNGFRLPEIQDDFAFAENLNNTFPIIGVGAFYKRDRLYAGISAPNLLTSKYIKNADGISEFGSEEIHVFLTAGYVYELTPSLKLKPSTLVKMVKGAPIVFDASLNVLINDRFEVGTSYRLEDSVSLMFNMSVLPSVRLGYSYDYTLSNLSAFSSGSHEIFVLFDLDLLGLRKGYDKSPRFY